MENLSVMHKMGQNFVQSRPEGMQKGIDTEFLAYFMETAGMSSKPTDEDLELQAILSEVFSSYIANQRQSNDFFCAQGMQNMQFESAVNMQIKGSMPELQMTVPKETEERQPINLNGEYQQIQSLIGAAGNETETYIHSQDVDNQESSHMIVEDAGRDGLSVEKEVTESAMNEDVGIENNDLWKKGEGEHKEKIESSGEADDTSYVKLPGHFSKPESAVIKISDYSSNVQSYNHETLPSEQITAKIKDNILMHKTQEGMNFEIELFPKELGRVSIKMDVSDDFVKMTIICEKDQTTKALMREFPGLNTVLEKQMGMGVSVEYPQSLDTSASGNYSEGNSHGQNMYHDQNNNQSNTSFEEYVNELIERSFFLIH